MFPNVNVSAVDAFNRSAPAVESTVIGGVKLEVFYDYYDNRPVDYICPGNTHVARSVGFRVAGQQDWFHHVAPPGSRSGDCNGPTIYHPKLWTKRLDYAAWLRWQVEVEHRLLGIRPFYHELNIAEAERIEKRAQTGRCAVSEAE